MITIHQTDFKGVGQVAKHCNLEKLEIAINEAIMFDLKPLLCGLFYDVDANWDEDSGVWYDIIEPKQFVGCGGKTQSHEGLRNVLVRYAYARYIILNNFDDTPNGGVTKTNEWSIPKPFADLKQVSERYRNMGLDLFKDVEAYICLNREDYPAADFDCKSCGCNGRCGSKTKIKGFGIQGRNVEKKL